MADDLDADWKQDHAAIMPSLTKCAYWSLPEPVWSLPPVAAAAAGPCRPSWRCSLGLPSCGARYRHMKKGGVYFENHVAAVPVCGPSRSSLLLSRYPHNNGYRMNGDIPSVASFCGPHGHMNDTVGNWLARAGYYTAFLGKHMGEQA
jgi:hypothetical protein